MPDPLNILIACGGTGGHLFPGVAVAEELDRRGHKVLLLISEKEVDAQASEKYGRLDFLKVPAIAKPSTFSLRMIPFLFRLWRTIQQCRAILNRNQCHAVLGMGGFTPAQKKWPAWKIYFTKVIRDHHCLRKAAGMNYHANSTYGDTMQ